MNEKTRVITLRSAVNKDMTPRFREKHPSIEVIDYGTPAWMPKNNRGEQYYQHFLCKKIINQK